MLTLKQGNRSTVKFHKLKNRRELRNCEGGLEVASNWQNGHQCAMVRLRCGETLRDDEKHTRPILTQQTPRGPKGSETVAGVKPERTVRGRMLTAYRLFDLA